MSLEIIYQDDQLVAINKPSGLLVHRSAIDRHETRFAMQMLRDQLGQHVFPLHRLDKPTSGVLLFALHREMAARMMCEFEQGRVKKRYLAVVRGYSEAHGMIDYALKEPHDKMTDALADSDKPAQSAITEYQQLGRVEFPHAVGRYNTARYSLLSLTPHTGRRHQLRRHMKHIFHPIIGDTSYGDGRHNRFFRQQFGVERLLLHAAQLSFQHPALGEDIAIKAGMDEPMLQLLAACDWQLMQDMP